MKERAEDLPKKDLRRNAVAGRIASLRGGEKGIGAYSQNREAWEYVEELKGLEHLFSYVKELESHTVLDIGAGTTRGVHELSQSDWGKGLNFEATALRYRPVIERNLGSERTRITSAEVLRGVPDHSIGCVLALFSIAYSADPELAILGIDRVLVPGGALKALFRAQHRPERPDAARHSTLFTKTLRELHYDISIADMRDSALILAIKPGGEASVTARELLQADQDSIVRQVVFAGKNSHLFKRSQ